MMSKFVFRFSKLIQHGPKEKSKKNPKFLIFRYQKILKSEGCRLGSILEKSYNIYFQENYPKAQEYYEQSCRINPADGAVWNQLGLISSLG